jgi:ABC-2 type transport system ATP-binding protein
MPSSDNVVLETIELTKVFRDFWGRESVKALDSLNMAIRQGEVFGLLGPNGSGKTTCVRMILGLLFPSRGAIRLFGRPPQDVDIKKRVGYMPEESHLYSYLNGEETLDFFGRLFRLPAGERRRRTEALIDMVGLRRARKRPVGQYSKGMARRIGLAQSLINDPDFLILDEPTTGLDPIGTREMKDLILTLRDRGKTILLCSHLLADVEEICDRISILYGGKQRAVGTVTELLTSSEITQIRAPRLPDNVVSKVMEVIRAHSPGAAPVEVSAPAKRLEDYFLGVVEEARRERLVTAGAEQGTGAAAFLGGEDVDTEEFLRELVEVPQAQDAAPAPGHQPEAVFESPDGRAVIDQLVGGTRAAGEQDAKEGEARPAGLPEAGVDKGVLDELLAESDRGEADGQS